MAGFGLEDDTPGRAHLLRRFEVMLQEHQAAGRRCLLVVDEVQNLSIAALEELRMLSNLTANGGAALQTILLGQPQFRRMLASADLDQLRQRVLASYHLGPLTREETRAYIEHRLTTAGWTGTPHWEDAAFDTIYRYSDGIPRRINRLASRVLMHGALDESGEITADMVEATADELDQDLKGMEGELPPAPVSVAVQSPDRSAEDSRLIASLSYRVETLEERVGKRERLFQKLADVFSPEPQR
jgi:Holliday junction resolvasome RuvABC ATP-dependent DNA helicase subunit